MPGLVAREAAEVTSPSQRFGSTSKGHPGTSRHHQWHIQITEPYKSIRHCCGMYLFTTKIFQVYKAVDKAVSTCEKKNDLKHEHVHRQNPKAFDINMFMVGDMGEYDNRETIFLCAQYF